MAGKKDYSVVNVTTGLTKKQASDLIGAMSRAKNTIAPNSRTTAAVTTRDGVAHLLQKGTKQITG